MGLSKADFVALPAFCSAPQHCNHTSFKTYIAFHVTWHHAVQLLVDKRKALSVALQSGAVKPA